jgi:hypothetical protein
MAATPKEVTLNSWFRTEHASESEDDATLLAWQLLLATATSAHERDKINDVSGKSVATARRPVPALLSRCRKPSPTSASDQCAASEHASGHLAVLEIYRDLGTSCAGWGRRDRSPPPPAMASRTRVSLPSWPCRFDPGHPLHRGDPC